jgi:uncharacterized protein (DUF983 family)
MRARLLPSAPEVTTVAQPSFLDKLFRALFLTCPVCWNGPMFEHPLKMHDDCPTCGYHFDKGNGYFLGAMYASYMLCLVPTALTAGVLYLMAMPLWLSASIVVVQTGILGPFVVFPLSRVFWVWAERDGHLHDGHEDRERLKAEAIERGRRKP